MGDAVRVAGMLHKQVHDFREDVRRAPTVWAACRRRALEIKAQEVSPTSSTLRVGTPMMADNPNDAFSFCLDDESEEASSGDEEASGNEGANDADAKSSTQGGGDSIF